jgi:hypothetical protein
VCPNKATCTYKHPAVACKHAQACFYKTTCIFSHSKPCLSGARCHAAGCKFAHVVAENVENAAETQVLSDSLPFTPPREVKDVETGTDDK